MILSNFSIECLPPKATSQMKGACRVGNGIRFFKKKAVQQAENTLFALLQPYAPETPHLGPLRLKVVWSFPWRKSETKARRGAGALPCDVRPDLSNLVKMVEDCMTTLRFWNDDGQVAELQISKQWANWSGFAIRIESDPAVQLFKP